MTPPRNRLMKASDAARALGVSLDTLRRWDRDGRIRCERDASNRRMVPLSEVERLRGGPPPVKTGTRLSARNRISGVVRHVKADGVTAADLKEQFEHNRRTRQLVTDVNQLVVRVRGAQSKLRNATGADAEKAKQVEAIAAKLLTEPVRYGKPGLQAHITYLAGMTTSADQKIGRDAVERYAVLKKELDAIRADVDRLLGSM